MSIKRLIRIAVVIPYVILLSLVQRSSGLNCWSCASKNSINDLNIKNNSSISYDVRCFADLKDWTMDLGDARGTIQTGDRCSTCLTLIIKGDTDCDSKIFRGCRSDVKNPFNNELLAEKQPGKCRSDNTTGVSGVSFYRACISTQQLYNDQDYSKHRPDEQKCSGANIIAAFNLWLATLVYAIISSTLFKY